MALPYSAQALHLASQPEVPIIHFAIGAHLLPLIRQAGGDVIGIDFHTDLAAAWQRLGDGVAVQGNLDPALLTGPFEAVQAQTARILDSVRGHAGHIFNLGHGVLKETPPENVAALVRLVHDYFRT